MPHQDTDILPDGNLFAYWEQKPTFTKTYYVAQNHPLASDNNPGTQERPFATIGKAAALLQPGERVIIDSGLYREFVRPARGGTDPTQMISYEAAPAAETTITGAEIWQTDWQPSTGWHVENPTPGARVWWGRLPGCRFDGINPFGITNLPKAAHTSKDVREALLRHDRPGYWMRRGLLFVDGQPLRQVLDYTTVWQEPGTFWVEDDGVQIHFRLADDSDPRDHLVEFTAREQCFQPAKPYQGYIRVKGLCFEKVGNGIPVPQHAALSTFCGHHWIIEDNTVRWANTVGIDIGHQTWHRESQELSGYQIVRGNIITDCGVCGLAGVGGGADNHLWHTLVEHNTIERCGWHDVERIYENAGIKLHLVRNTIVRHNLVRDTGHGPGIWLDFNNVNSRACYNVVINTQSCLQGGMFVEASHKANRVDHNVVWGVGAAEGHTYGGHGFYEHDCDHLLVDHNIIGGCEGTAVYLNLGERERISAGRGSTGRKHRIMKNILTDCKAAILLPTEDNATDGNLFGAFAEQGPLRIQNPLQVLDLEAWQEFHGWEACGATATIQVELNEASMTLQVVIYDGQSIKEAALDLRGNLDLDILFPA